MIKTSFQPLVSVVIPVYNGGRYLAEAIDSALAQTYPNIEVLVVNDGSSDFGETERVALSYGCKIRYCHKVNGGVASALNVAVEMMAGEYFSWLSHDDLYVNNKVERQVDALSRVSCADRAKTIIYSDHEVFTTDSNNSIPVRLREVPPEHFRYWITVENTLHGCTLLIPKSAFLLTGMFDETLRTTQDYDLWFRMARSHYFVHLRELLVKARSHSEQGSIKMSELALKECNTLLSGFVVDLSRDELLRATQHEFAVAYAQIAAHMWQRGFLDVGRLAMRLSLACFKSSSFRSNITAICIIANGRLMYFFVGAIRSIISPRVRLAIRRWLSWTKEEDRPGPNLDRNISLKKKFSAIYENNLFRGRLSRSGEGSDMVQTAAIRQELPGLIQKLGIRIFLDAPCGDWYWMREMNLPVERYIGLDIVDALVETNQKSFGSEKVSFQCGNLADCELPKADLIFSRDCLVHLSFADSLKILANFKRSGATYLLTTTFTSLTKNEDLGDGFWRPLNKRLAPFNFPEPICLINEDCTEADNLFKDKCLGLWRLQDLHFPESD